MHGMENGECEMANVIELLQAVDSIMSKRSRDASDNHPIFFLLHLTFNISPSPFSFLSLVSPASVVSFPLTGPFQCLSHRSFIVSPLSREPGASFNRVEA